MKWPYQLIHFSIELVNRPYKQNKPAITQANWHKCGALRFPNTTYKCGHCGHWIDNQKAMCSLMFPFMIYQTLKNGQKSVNMFNVQENGRKGFDRCTNQNLEEGLIPIHESPTYWAEALKTSHPQEFNKFTELLEMNRSSLRRLNCALTLWVPPSGPSRKSLLPTEVLKLAVRQIKDK